MKSSLREILIESYVADVAIAVLLLGALEFGFRVLCLPLWRIATYLFTAIAIVDIPYSSPGVGLHDRFMFVNAVFFCWVR
jgi:hypothetical protein